MGTLWETLPAGFLKKGYAGWCRLDWQVQKLIVELAERQRFRCALCDRTSGLEIEHESDPKYGPGDKYTIYNIRGLACRGCNWRIMMFEKEERGEYTAWELYSKLSDHDYWNYIYAYEHRMFPLAEAALKQDLGYINYWYRRNLLEKFDDWKEGWGEYPWRWGFEEIKEKRHGKIRTPRQFINGLSAIVNFVVEEHRKDPNYRPPEKVVRVLFRAKEFLDGLRPFFEERLKALGYTINEGGHLVEPAGRSSLRW